MLAFTRPDTAPSCRLAGRADSGPWWRPPQIWSRISHPLVSRAGPTSVEQAPVSRRLMTEHVKRASTALRSLKDIRHAKPSLALSVNATARLHLAAHRPQ